MTEIYNQQKQKTIRRLLRNKSVKAERILWSKLRQKQLGYKFRRQFGIGKYVADFYCPNLKIAIEVDGCTHSEDEELAYDERREDFLISMGIRVIRFLNSDIYKNMDGVIEKILETIEDREILYFNERDKRIR